MERAHVGNPRMRRTTPHGTTGGGAGRWFAIEWHTSDDASAATAIYLDSIMDAYDWVVACQAGEVRRPVTAVPPDDDSGG